MLSAAALYRVSLLWAGLFLFVYLVVLLLSCSRVVSVSCYVLAVCLCYCVLLSLKRHSSAFKSWLTSFALSFLLALSCGTALCKLPLLYPSTLLNPCECTGCIALEFLELFNKAHPIRDFEHELEET
jgi:hypothetical protein